MKNYYIKNIKYLLFAVALFFSFSVVVDAKVRCTYTWENIFFSTEKDDNGDWIPVQDKFVLETEDDNNKLTKATSPREYINIKFKTDDEEGVELTSDGQCPQISIYLQLTMNNYLIYEDKKACEDGFLTTNSRCSETLSGTYETNPENSPNDEAGSGIAFQLASNIGGSCRYIRTDGDNYTTTIRLRDNGNNEVTGSCQTTFIGVNCRPIVSVPEQFFNNGTFSCPTYIYANERLSGTDSATYIYDIIGTGDENDSPDMPLGDDPIAGVDTEGWNSEIACDDIFHFNQVGSVGWMLQTIFNYIKIIGPILVVLLSSIDFIKAVLGTDEKAMKEAQSKLIIRLIAALALFLIPTLLQLLLSLINIALQPECFLH